MISSSDILHIGTLTRTHGQSGEVQCHLINDYWYNNQASFIILQIDGIFVPFRVHEWRIKGEDILLMIQDVNQESTARRLIGCEAYMLRTDITDTESDTSLTYQDLIGWTVITPHQQRKIVEVDESTINTLAILDDGAMIPLHEDLMIELDEDAKRLVLDLPEGL